MIEYNERNIVNWSKIGPRATYGQAILKIAETNSTLLALSADLANSSGLDRFKSSFPERFINIGIAEQNMIGVAAGLAKEGFTVFASSFAPFLTFRASEQIRMNMNYMNLNIKTIGIGSGLSMGSLGYSHYGIEDISVLRSLGNVTILSPADSLEVVKCVEASLSWQGPVYIRLTGAPNNPMIYSEDYHFEIGKATKIKDGNRIAILATGSIVAECLDAALKLEELGIRASVYNFSTIVPLDIDLIDELSRKVDFFVTVEEHTKLGGFGSAIAEYLAPMKESPQHLILGTPPGHQIAGSYEYMKETCGLDSVGIFSSIRDFLGDNV